MQNKLRPIPTRCMPSSHNAHSTCTRRIEECWLRICRLNEWLL